MSNAEYNMLKEYFSAVEKGLVCGKQRRREVISSLRSDVADYIGERGTVTREEIVSVFGTPEQIAAGVAENMETGELKKRLTLKKAVVCALIAVVALYALFIAVSLVDVHTEAHGFLREGFLFIKESFGAVMRL